MKIDVLRIHDPGGEAEQQCQHEGRHQHRPQTRYTVNRIAGYRIGLPDLVEQAAPHQPATDDEKHQYRVVRKPGSECESFEPDRWIHDRTHARVYVRAQVRGGNLDSRQPAQ